MYFFSTKPIPKIEKGGRIGECLVKILGLVDPRMVPYSKLWMTSLTVDILLGFNKTIVRVDGPLLQRTYIQR